MLFSGDLLPLLLRFPSPTSEAFLGGPLRCSHVFTCPTSMAQLHAAGSLFLMVGVLLGRNRLSYHFWRQLFEIPGSRKRPFKPMEPTSLSGQSSSFTASWLHKLVAKHLIFYTAYALDCFLRPKSQIAADEGSLLCTFWVSSTTHRPDCHSLK